MREASTDAGSPHEVSCPPLRSVWPPSIEMTPQRLTATSEEGESRVTFLPVKGRTVIWRNLQRVLPLGVMMGLDVYIQDLWVQVQGLPLTTGDLGPIS